MAVTQTYSLRLDADRRASSKRSHGERTVTCPT